MTTELLDIPANAGRLLLERGGTFLCPLLKANDFARYCTEREHPITPERLLAFERLRLFFPIFRIAAPAGKRIQLHLPLRDDTPFRDGAVVDTASRPEYPVPDDIHSSGEAYYSIFQISSLTFVLSQFTAKVSLEGFLDEVKPEAQWTSIGQQLGDVVRAGVDQARRHAYRPAVDLLCQFISDRYYPLVRGNQRSIQFTEGGFVFDEWTVRNARSWRWHEYARNWSPCDAETAFALTPAKLRHAYEGLAMLQSREDPIASWHQLVQFIAVAERDRLKGAALCAETMRYGALMLRRLYKDLYGEDLRVPNEVHGTVITHIPELSVRDDPLRYLEYVVNRYDLNPRPKLTLFVEGPSEEIAVRHIFEHYFGTNAGVHGIEIIVLGGVDTATGGKQDRYRAILRLVDYLHHHQTFAFVVLDTEGTAEQLKRSTREALSTLHPGRYATRPDYVHLWRVSFEFDNFSNTEIACALTAISGGGARFRSVDIAVCRKDKVPGAALKKLYTSRLGYKPDKLALARILVEAMLSPTSRRNAAKRPIVKVLERITRLAAFNPFPTMQQSWEYNQRSNYLGKRRGKKVPLRDLEG